MFYRVVCSLEEISVIKYSLPEEAIIVSLDAMCGDEFICIKENDEPILLIIYNPQLLVNMITKLTTMDLFLGIVINIDEIEFAEKYTVIKERYAKGEKKMSELKLEEVVEEQMTYSDDDLYNINSWGADLSFREIISMYEDNELIKPELQRKYVWGKTEASRFIDSILLGLPVPSVFFAKEQDETMLIIDGFQRIMTVYDFVNGIFSGDGKIFKLSNTENINKRWRGKAFAELEQEEKRRIRNTTIHAIIFEQKHPRNDTGMFQIFERINTGGRTLKAQEIRNCVYQGKCNDLLFRLNKQSQWRELLGLKAEDARMADIELILRYFAMNELCEREEAKTKQINLAKYLNQYMSDKTNATDEEIEFLEEQFIQMVNTCKKLFGSAAFKNLKKNTTSFTNKINPAIFDALAVATTYAISVNCIDYTKNYTEKYIELLLDEEFCFAASNRTTNVENIMKRIGMATEKIYGVRYERGICTEVK